MTGEIKKPGEGPLVTPTTIIPDKLGETHDGFMKRIRELRSSTDPNADDYGRDLPQDRDRALHGKGPSPKK